jgi:hypothetical protein
MDDVVVKGRLTVYRVQGRERVEVFSENNLITNAGLYLLPWILASDLSNFNGVARTQDLAVQRMEIGNNPAAIPTITDTTSVSSFVYAPTVECFPEEEVAAGLPGTLGVSFGGYLPPDAGNDPATPGSTSWTLHEEALLLGNGVVFAKKCFSIHKNNTFGLYFKHNIRFGRG